MADNRENTLLQAIAESEEISEARTSDETFLKAIADGDDKPEEVRNRLQYWLSQIEVGGGNPNYIETITGTLANPWESVDLANLRTEIQNNDATVYINFTDGTSQVRIFLRYESAFFGGDCSTFFGASLLGSYYLQYASNGSLFAAKKFSSKGVASNIATSTATTLTIIHHPLPTT